MMDFWDPEIMKIVLLLKRGLDLHFSRYSKQIEKSMQKGLPKSMFLGQKFSRGPLAPERGVLGFGGCVSVWMHPTFALHLAFILDAPFLALYPFAIYFVFLQDRILKARELPAHFSSKWDYFSAPFFYVFSIFWGINFWTFFGKLLVDFGTNFGHIFRSARILFRTSFLLTFCTNRFRKYVNF